MSSPSPSPAGAPAPFVAEIVVRHGDLVLDVQHVVDGRYVIGEGPQASFTVQLPPEVDRAGVPLVIALAEQAVLGLVPGMTGTLVHGEQTLQIAELLAMGRRSYGLLRGDRCEIRLGALSFEIASVDPAEYAPARRPLDRLYWLSNAGSLLVIGALVLLGEPRPPGELALEEIAASRERAVRYLTNVPPPPPEPERPRPTVSVQKTRSSPKPAAPPPEPLLAVPAEPSEAAPAIPRTKRGIGDKYSYARTAGFLNDEGFGDSTDKMLADSQEAALAYGNSAADTAFWNGVASSKPRGPKFGGLELAETERGGGVHGERKRTPTTSGKAVEVNTNTGPSHTDEERAAARRVVTIVFETPSVQGELDPDNVQKALRKQDGGLRRCYKQATGSEDREAHVLFRVKVDANGRVTSATLEHGSKGVGDLGPCITAAARTWKFAAPLDSKPAQIVVEAALSSRTP